MAESDLTAEQLRELLSYDRETGIFRWNVANKRVRIGSDAGHLHPSGYRRIGIYRRVYSAHRLAWLYVHGAFPLGDIDHINGARDDNRIANLRDVPHAVNMQNLRTAPRTNIESGLLGVSTSLGRWKAQIRLNGSRMYLGTFSTPEEAHAAYLEAKRLLHLGCTI
jgi:hypothetical protein